MWTVDCRGLQEGCDRHLARDDGGRGDRSRQVLYISRGLAVCASHMWGVSVLKGWEGSDHILVQSPLPGAYA